MDSWYDSGSRLSGSTVPSTDPTVVPQDEERWGGALFFAASLLNRSSAPQLSAHHFSVGSLRVPEPPPATEESPVSTPVAAGAVVVLAAAAYFFTQTGGS